MLYQVAVISLTLEPRGPARIKRVVIAGIKSGENVLLAGLNVRIFEALAAAIRTFFHAVAWERRVAAYLRPIATALPIPLRDLIALLAGRAPRA
jgi:hypothetical protein